MPEPVRQSTAIKVLGERNSGTIYIEELIRCNFAVDLLRGIEPEWVEWLQKPVPGKNALVDLFFHATIQHNLGWKHMLAMPKMLSFRKEIDRRSISFVTITKNPYSWLLSLYRRPHHYRGKLPASFEEFLLTPWRTVSREFSPEYYLNPIDLWNRKNAAYLEMQQHFRVVNVRYEDLLVDIEPVLSLLEGKFILPRKAAHFVNVEHSTKNDPKTYDNYRDYYLGEQWKSLISDQAIAIIRSKIDRDVIREFGYDIL